MSRCRDLGFSCFRRRRDRRRRPVIEPLSTGEAGAASTPTTCWKFISRDDVVQNRVRSGLDKSAINAIYQPWLDL
jgi:hypothetical protein